MEYGNALAELVNEFKYSAEELKVLISGINKSIENKDIMKEKKREQPPMNVTVELLEEKIALVESKLFSYFENDLSKELDLIGCHPLAKNHLILRTILDFLDFASLKNFRQVCKMWEGISESLFRKTAKIEFGSNRKTLERFCNDFPLNSVVCSNFVFKETLSSLELFTNFCILNRESITSMELLSNIHFKDVDGNINSLNIDNLIGPSLRRLKINSSIFYGLSTQLRISMSKLKCIEYLSLKSCVLIVSEEYPRIEPKEVSLENVSFFCENSGHIEDVCLNDFIDFRQCTKILLDGSYNFNNYDDSTSLVFPPGISLESVDLIATNYSWKRSNKPKIKNLRLVSAQLDLGFLSAELETLEFSLMTSINPQQIFLPKLKYLRCPIRSQNIFPRLSVFSSCRDLVSVSLENIQDRNFEGNLNWLPLSVKKVQLDGIKIIGDRFHGRLTSLHLLHYSLSLIEDILTKITTDNLYISSMGIVTNRRLPSFPTDSLLRIIQQPLKTCALGKIIWADQDNFRNSDFAHIVDRRSECYLFENGRGKAIPYEQLQELMKLFP